MIPEGTPLSTAADLVEQGWDALTRGGLERVDWDAVRTAFDGALALDPQHPVALAGRALVRAQDGDVPGALAALEEAIRLAPTEPRCYLLRALTHQTARQFDASLADFDQVAKLQPPDGRFFVARAESYCGLKRWDDALADLDEAARRGTPDPAWWFFRGYACHQGEQYAEALAAFDRALAGGEGDAIAFLWRGSAYLALKDHARAREDYSTALRLQADLVSAYYYRGICHHWLDDDAAAAQDFTAATDAEPGNALAWFWRGISHYRLNQYGPAAEAFARFLHLEPTSPDACQAHFLSGISNHHLGNDEAALAAFLAACEAEPADAANWLWRGTCHYWLEEFEDALDALDEALRLDPDRAMAFYWRGMAWRSLRCPEEALADLAAYLQREPDAGVAFLDRARILAGLGETDLALADVTEAIRCQPDNAEAFNHRAQLLIDQDATEAALADFATAIRLEPTAAYHHEHLADLLDLLGRHAEADAAWARAEAIRGADGETDMPESKTLIQPLVVEHLGGLAEDQLAVTDRTFPARVAPDLQLALEAWAAGPERRARFHALRRHVAHHGYHQMVVQSILELLHRDRRNPVIAAPPEYQEYDVGADQPIRCLKQGLWLLAEGPTGYAVLHQVAQRCGTPVLHFQVAAPDTPDGRAATQAFFRHLEEAVRQARCYRGKVLSLAQEEQYDGQALGIQVHRLRQPPREAVILPPATLELLERNVLQFLRRRPQLARLGLATKKGLLFYGPPGTGKTHTIHYLAGALEGHTTLLITAGQMGYLAEYMTLARLLQPSIVVIEDVDLIARNREELRTGVEESLLNQLLNEMDGLQPVADILFILTTNRPEALEAALTARPGRIDQAIEFPYPDEEGRAKLIHLYSPGLGVPDAVLAEVVRRTPRVSAAFLKELMRRAAQFHLERAEGQELCLADVEGALEELLIRGGSLNRKLLGAVGGEE